MATREHTLEECEALKKEYEDFLNDIEQVNDIYVTITGGIITNENTSAGSTNPHECHAYQWTVKYVENPQQGTITHVKWCLTGDYPFDLIIDDPSGVIHGTIWILNEQPWIQDIIPKEKMRYDGSNWNRNGRPAGMYYDCNFYVSRVYDYTPPATSGGSGSGSSGSSTLATGGSTGGSTGSGGTVGTTPTPIRYKTSPVLHTLRLIRSHTIDNYIIAKLYLSERENVVELREPPGAVKINKMNFNIGNKYYGIDEFDELLRVHPGPWPECGRDLV